MKKILKYLNETKPIINFYTIQNLRDSAGEQKRKVKNDKL